MRHITAWFSALTICLAAIPGASGGDWPMYRGDAARSGLSSNTLAANLQLSWTWDGLHAPQPAWPRSDRMPFDRAFHTVIADGLVFFGSSADGCVTALDARTGATRWTFQTDGPIRFAPAVWKDQLFVVSDDGHLYTLATQDGSLIRKRRGGPDERMVLGNEKMTSRWPARGGPVVLDDTVYFAAGVWPTEGIYLYALDAASGEIRWLNDDSGQKYMPQPHGGAEAASGISSQGYLVANADQLLVPTGRAVPASFDRSQGTLQYFHLQRYGHKGGAPTMVADGVMFNSGATYEARSGESLLKLGTGALAATKDGIVRSTDDELIRYRWTKEEKVDRKGNKSTVKSLQPVWTLKDIPGGVSVIVADKTIVVGGEKHVTLVDAASHKVLKRFDVRGTAYGLAAAGERLYVSTDLGEIHCFAQPASSDAPAKAALLKQTLNESPYGKNRDNVLAAETILQASGMKEGYCVDLACGDGGLAYELAKRSKLHIYAVDDDPRQVAKAREKLTAAGLYGVRVTVHHAQAGKTPYPRYIANLVVCGRSVTEADTTVNLDEALRLQRPFGGVACFGPAKELDISTRGVLEGAGSWTHQYADPGNSCCSTDVLVKGTLEMRWFRDVSLEMPQRHGRGPAPLYDRGRMIVEGMDALQCVDAYNGRSLWQFPLPGILKAYDSDHLMGTAGTQSNFCLEGDFVYVRTEDRCLKLDVATGQQVAEFKAPLKPDGKPGIWGYIAIDDGILFGSLVEEDHIVKWRYLKGDMTQLFTESILFFALDTDSGQVKWSHQPTDAIRHNAIAIGGGRVYLIDRALAKADLLQDAKKEPQPPGKLLALDAETGKVLWQRDEEIYGTTLSLSTKHDALLMSYTPTRFRLESEQGGRLSVLQASTGKPLWDQKAKYSSRPMINDRTVYAQDGAWDLLEGEERPFNFSRSYGCGILAGSANLMVFRSATLGYFDLNLNEGTTNYGGIRPGCWINAIPAGGMVLVPDASAGCQCSYVNKAWFSLQPAAGP
jgi:outer membrane protein assembly factor BamB